MDPNDIPTDNLLGECSDEELLREWRRRRAEDVWETDILVCAISKVGDMEHCATVGADGRYFEGKWA